MGAQQGVIVVDTNLVVRIIVNDDSQQVARAQRLLASNVVLLLTTVVLEVEWVLRSVYGLTRARTLSSIEDFCGLENVELAEPDQMTAALKLYGKGMDFADALHLCGCPQGMAFATFDSRLIAMARAEGGFVVVTPK